MKELVKQHSDRQDYKTLDVKVRYKKQILFYQKLILLSLIKNYKEQQ